jgi:hypothetical protein
VFPGPAHTKLCHGEWTDACGERRLPYEYDRGW